MERTVNYSVVRRKQMNNPGDVIGYYAQAQASGVMGIREMATRIQKMCTVTRSDTVAVLVALADVMSEGLAAGEIVRLGDLGSFQIGLNSQGAEEPEKFSAGMIKKAHINFRPGKDLAHILGTLSFKRVPVRKNLENPEEQPDAGKGENPETDHQENV